MTNLGSGRWQCQECGFQSKSTNVRYHIESKHLRSYAGYSCKYCGDVLKTRNALIEHTVLKYIAKQPNVENLMPYERKGLKKLVRRVKGENHGRQSMERASEAKELDSSTVPIVKFSEKDHKTPESNGDPKTRPICCCSRSINDELSEYMEDLMEAALDAKGGHECVSTEDLLS